jgi:hypothetical protein
MREGSTQAVELGTFFFLYFFVFWFFLITFFFPRQVEYSGILQEIRNSTTESEEREREREKETEETERSDSKKSLQQGEEKS